MKNHLYPILIIICFGLGECRSQTQKANSEVKPTANYTYAQPSADGTGKFYFGREIAQVMGAAGAGWLERNNRQQEENTALAIENMKLHANTVVADVGAGSGYYTFKIAPEVPQGKAYATDIQDEMIAMLKSRREKEKTANVVVVKSADTTTNLPHDSIDLVIMVDVYHELAYPHEILQSVRQALTDSGHLLLIEYRGEDPAVAIKPLHKTTVAQLNKELGANGFRLSHQGDFLPIQHFLMYSKTGAQVRE